MQVIILSAVLLVLTTGCIFKPNRFTGVISYRQGRVYIKHDRYYRVGLLPEGWQRMDTRARAISFYNPDLKSSISTDAFCKKGVGDRRLTALAAEILSALEDRRLLDSKEFQLDRRGALRQKMSGKMDGVGVVVDIVVTKRNGCAFDFYSVSTPENGEEVARDFEDFFETFHYE